MRKFNVSVNGKAYFVEVEEVGGAASTAPITAAAKAAPAAPQPTATKTASAAKGGVEVLSPMPGVIVKFAVSDGAVVKAGQPIVVLEAMKMENDIAATAAGTVSFAVKQGESVETDAVLAYIKA